MTMQGGAVLTQPLGLSNQDVLKYIRPTILVTDREGMILQAHGGSGRPLGYWAEELVGQHGIMLVAPEDHPVMAATYLATDGLPIVTAPEPFPIRMVGPGGQTRTWDCVPGGFSEGDEDGWVLTLTCRDEQSASVGAMDCFIAGGSPIEIARVVADRYQGGTHHEWRKEALVLYRDVTEDGPQKWTFVNPPTGTPAQLSDALAACIDAIDADEVPSSPLWDLSPGAIHSDSHLPPKLVDVARGIGLPYSTTLAVGLNGVTQVIFLRFSNFTDQAQVNSTFSDQAVDATLRRSLQDQASRSLLGRTMRRDPLTGIANRLCFDEIVEANQDASTSAVLYVDIDKFKAVNDTFGHATGDAVLKAVANRIVRACRPDDIVARIGGDEFAVVLGSISGEEAHGVAARIQSSMNHPLNVADGPDLVTVTIGIATPTGQMALEDLIQAADLAMLAAKPVREGDDQRVTKEPYAMLSDRRVRRP